MKKIIAIIDCSIPINSRNQKISNSIKSYYPDYDIHIITWNREEVSLNKENNFHAYHRIAPYANAKANFVDLGGNIIRDSSKEAIISMYALTMKTDNIMEGVLTKPEF